MTYVLTIDGKGTEGTLDEHIKTIAGLKFSEDEKSMLASGVSIGSEDNGTYMILEPVKELTSLEKLEIRIKALEDKLGI